MSMTISVIGEAAVTKRIKVIFDEYNKEAYNIFKAYAAEIMVYFMEVQGNIPAEVQGKFWTNHTFGAVMGFFAQAWQVPHGSEAAIGLTLGNTTWYAELLENDYGGRFASFPHLLERFQPMIMFDLQMLYGEI